MTVQHHKPKTLIDKDIRWFTPMHRMWTTGRGPDGRFYYGRVKTPSFLISSESQSEAEEEAGRIVNRHVGDNNAAFQDRTSPRVSG